jgi:hypothetical protein
MLRGVANWDDRFSQHKEVSEREWREGAATQFLRISTSAGRRSTDYFKRRSTSKRVERNKYGVGSELGKVDPNGLVQHKGDKGTVSVYIILTDKLYLHRNVDEEGNEPLTSNSIVRKRSSKIDDWAVNESSQNGLARISGDSNRT